MDQYEVDRLLGNVSDVFQEYMKLRQACEKLIDCLMDTKRPGEGEPYAREIAKLIGRI